MVMVNDKLFNEGRRARFPYPSVTTKSGPLITAEALAGIETPMKVLQTSRSFFEVTREFLSKFSAKN